MEDGRVCWVGAEGLAGAAAGLEGALRAGVADPRR